MQAACNHPDQGGPVEGGTHAAREPDEQGYVERDGVRVAYESFGDAATTVLFPPVDTIVDSRVWKGQEP